MKKEKPYPGDLTDGQRQIIGTCYHDGVDSARETICRRGVINAILYALRTGCPFLHPSG